jgi:hypothetical protein
MTSLERLLVGLVVFALALFSSYRWGYSAGVDTEQAAWQKKEQTYKDAELVLRAEHDKHVARVLDANYQTNLKNHRDHETVLEKVHADLAAARAESRRLGGLRIPAPASSCRDAGTLAQTTGAGQRDEKAPATIALPEAVETRLWSIVGEADVILEQARACQAWIIDNGFYGKDPAQPGAD